MEKTFLDAQTFLQDSWRLARIVMDSGWNPTTLVALWRGGASVGVAVHEFFRFHGIELQHMPLKCSSYIGIDASVGKVTFYQDEEVFGAVKRGDRVLVVDDVFDSGRTAAAMKEMLDSIPGVDSRIACVYWKPSRNLTDIEPDFHTKTLGDEWIVFPHEMEGLTFEEISSKDPVLAGLVKKYQ